MVNEEVRTEDKTFLPEEIFSDFAFWEKKTRSEGTTRNEISRGVVNNFFDKILNDESLKKEIIGKYMAELENSPEGRTLVRDQTIRFFQKELNLPSKKKVCSQNISVGDHIEYEDGIQGIVTQEPLPERYIRIRKIPDHKAKDIHPKNTRLLNASEEESQKILEDISKKDDREIYREISEDYTQKLTEIKTRKGEILEEEKERIFEKSKDSLGHYYVFGDKSKRVINKTKSVRDLEGKLNEINDIEQKRCFDAVRAQIKQSVKKAIPDNIEFDKEGFQELLDFTEQHIMDHGTFTRIFSRGVPFMEENAKRLKIEGISDDEKNYILEHIERDLDYCDHSFGTGHNRDQIIKSLMNPEKKLYSLDIFSSRMEHLRIEYQNQVIKEKLPEVKALEWAENIFGDKLAENAMQRYDNLMAHIKGGIVNQCWREIKNSFVEELKNRGLLDKNNYTVPEKLEELVEERKQTQIVEIERLSQEKGLNINQSPIYTFGKIKLEGGRALDPYAIGQEFLEDLVKTFSQNAKTARQKDIGEVAKTIILGDEILDSKSFRKVLTKPGKISYDTIRKIMENEYDKVGDKPTPHFHIITSENHPKARIRGAVENHGQYLAQRDILVDEMIQIMSQGVKKGSGGIGDNYRIFWERFRPEEYDLEWVNKNRNVYPNDNIGNSRFTFEVSEDPEELAKAISSSGACLTKRNMEAVLDDPASINLIMYEENGSLFNGKRYVPIGYTRNNICVMDDGSSVLAMDTLEVGHKQFEQLWDKNRALGLATCQMSLDMGFDYLVGRDARVKYGIREAFGNHSREITLQRLGESKLHFQGYGQFGYKFSGTPPTHQGKSFILMKNWKGEDKK